MVCLAKTRLSAQQRALMDPGFNLGLEPADGAGAEADWFRETSLCYRSVNSAAGKSDQSFDFRQAEDGNGHGSLSAAHGYCATGH